MTNELKELVARLTAYFKRRGLFTNTYSDKPNEVSAPHAHGGATLVTLEGSVEVRLDNGTWQTAAPGDITVIKDNQLHEVKAGNAGWRYLFACSQQEARRQGLLGAEPNKKAKAILDVISYITIATMSDDDQPWNTPVASFHFDNDYTLYWASWQDNQHSQNIRANGKAFVVVYDSTPADNKPSAGVYMKGQAFELVDDHEVMQAALVFKDDPYNPSDGKQYLGEHPRRIYKFIPEQIWMNDDDKVNDNFVDVRKEAEA